MVYVADIILDTLAYLGTVRAQWIELVSVGHNSACLPNMAPGNVLSEWMISIESWSHLDIYYNSLELNVPYVCSLHSISCWTRTGLLLDSDSQSLDMVAQLLEVNYP